MNYNLDTILLHDTSIMSENRGDNIIMSSIKYNLSSLFPLSYFINIPTHDYPSIEAKKSYDKCSISFVCGTNLLSSNMNIYNQWKINTEIINNTEIILLGVGWWQYQSEVNEYTNKLLNKILSKNYIHSVRDEYTKNKLNSIGIYNVINTSCPTLWQIKKTSHILGQNKEVLFTLTDYSKDVVNDKILIKILQSKYKKLHFWIQGSRDYKYLKEICEKDLHKINIIPPSLDAYDNFLALSLDKIDYIGTRLHAGIRAINYGINTLIISIDNRAKEIHKNTNIPILERNNLDSLQNMLLDGIEHTINIPYDNIQNWKKQFKSIKQ